MQNFENIQEGTEVVISSRYSVRKAPVTRVLKNYFEADGLKFSKTSGKLVTGNAWDFTYADVVSTSSLQKLEQCRLKVRKENMRAKLKKALEEDLDYATMESCYKFAKDLGIIKQE